MHYYQFHIGDHARASYHLTNEEDLAFRRLKDMYHETEMPIPLDTDSVARRLRLETQWVISVLKDFFFEGADGWHMAEIDAAIASYRKNAAKNAENGKKGGRPKGKNEPSENPVGYESHPTGNPKPLTINHKPITNTEIQKPARAGADRPADVSDGVWREWCRHRKAKKSIITDAVVRTFRKEAEKAGLTLEAGIELSIARGWTGLNAEWVAGANNGRMATNHRTVGGIADQLAAYDV